MLLEMTEIGICAKSDLNKTKEFYQKAESIKTPKNKQLNVSKIDPYVSSFDRQEIQKEVKLQPGG